MSSKSLMSSIDAGRLLGNGSLLLPLFPLPWSPFSSHPLSEVCFSRPRGTLKTRRNISQANFDHGRAVRAYLFILEKFYNIKQSMNLPIVYIVTDPETGLDRHYQYHYDFRFVDVSARKPPSGAQPGGAPVHPGQHLAALGRSGT
jgi:hypothetical protein